MTEANNDMEPHICGGVSHYEHHEQLNAARFAIPMQFT